MVSVPKCGGDFIELRDRASSQSSVSTKTLGLGLSSIIGVLSYGSFIPCNSCILQKNLPPRCYIFQKEGTKFPGVVFRGLQFQSMCDVNLWVNSNLTKGIKQIIY